MDLEHLDLTIGYLDENAKQEAQKRWNSIIKPIHSLGKLEDLVIQIAGIKENPDFQLDKKGLVIMCADNGIVEEGVTQSGQEITKIVSENFLKGNTCVSLMASCAGVDVFPVDMGIAADNKLQGPKIRQGTTNMTKGPAMSKEEGITALKAGMDIVSHLKKQGYQIIATGEMGIGNTSSSSAIASVLLNRSVEEVTGKGAGLLPEQLPWKIKCIQKAIKVNQPNPNDPMDVLVKVGGLDIAGLTGVFLGGAKERVPIVMDGFISSVAALLAARIHPMAIKYQISSHTSKEPAAKMILKELGHSPVLDADLCLGEGSGAMTLMPILDMALKVYQQMCTFESNGVEAYRVEEKRPNP